MPQEAAYPCCAYLQRRRVKCTFCKLSRSLVSWTSLNRLLSRTRFISDKGLCPELLTLIFSKISTYRMSHNPSESSFPNPTSAVHITPPRVQGDGPYRIQTSHPRIVRHRILDFEYKRHVAGTFTMNACPRRAASWVFDLFLQEPQLGRVRLKCWGPTRLMPRK